MKLFNSYSVNKSTLKEKLFIKLRLNQLNERKKKTPRALASEFSQNKQTECLTLHLRKNSATLYALYYELTKETFFPKRAKSLELLKQNEAIQACQGYHFEGILSKKGLNR